MLDLLIAIGIFTVGSVVFVYTWTRGVIMLKTNSCTLETFLSLMCPTHTLSFWSVNEKEDWRLFSKVTRYYLSHHYINGSRVNRFCWWADFLNDRAVKS